MCAAPSFYVALCVLPCASQALKRDVFTKLCSGVLSLNGETFNVMNVSGHNTSLHPACLLADDSLAFVSRGASGFEAAPRVQNPQGVLAITQCCGGAAVRMPCVPVRPRMCICMRRFDAQGNVEAAAWHDERVRNTSRLQTNVGLHSEVGCRGVTVQSQRGFTGGTATHRSICQRVRPARRFRVR